VPEAVAANRKGTGGISWIQTPTFEDLRHGVLALAGGSRASLVIFLLAGCFGIALAARRRERWQYGFAAAWFVVPVLGSFAASFVQPMFIPYYLIVGLPGLLLLAAAGIARLPRPAAAALLVALVSLSGLRLADWYAERSQENWRGAAQFVLAGAHGGDGILFYPSYLNTPFEYYERRRGARLETLDPSAGALALGKSPRIWLAFQVSHRFPAPSEFVQLEARVRRAHRLALRRAFVGVTVELYRAS
jgi:hypothetical protein